MTEIKNATDNVNIANSIIVSNNNNNKDANIINTVDTFDEDQITNSKQALQGYLEETHPDWNFHWKRAGNQIVGFCPFHNDSRKPNLYITDKGDGAFYKCFACGASGSIKTLKKYKTDPEYREKIGQKREIFKITGLLAKFFAVNLLSEKGDEDHEIVRELMIEYLDNRNKQIYDSLQNKIIIGFIPRNFDVESKINEFYDNHKINIKFEQLPEDIKAKFKTLDKCSSFMVFFYTDIDGNITGFKLRNTLNEDEYRSNKQIFTVTFAEQNGFLLSRIADCIDEFKEVYLVEGEFDALSVYAYFNTEDADGNLGMLDENNEQEIKEDNALRIIAAGGLDNMYNLAKMLVSEGYIPILIPDFDNAGQNSIRRIIENAKRDKILNKIGAVVLDNDNKDLNNGAKDIDELFSSSSTQRSTFFINIKPKPLGKILREIKIREEELILDKISNKTQNLQEVFLEYANINPDKIRTTKIKKVDVLKVMDEKLPPLDFIMPGFKANTVGVFYASSGSGKSFLSLEIAAAVAGAPNILSRYPKSGMDVDLFNINKHGKAVYLSFEDDIDVLNIRTKKIMNYIKFVYGKKFNDIKDTLAKNFNVISLFGSGITISNPEKIIKYCKDSRIVVIDTLSRFNDYEENSNTEMAKFIVQLEKIIAQTGTTFLVIHHITKNKDDEGGYSRGAGAIDSNSRFKCTLTATQNSNIKIFAVKKANYGAAEQSIALIRLTDEDFYSEFREMGIQDEYFNFGGILIPAELNIDEYPDNHTYVKSAIVNSNQNRLANSERQDKKYTENTEYDTVDFNNINIKNVLDSD